MTDNTCITCGAIIPEGRHICLLCEKSNEAQIFQQHPPKAKRYFRITDDCGWTYYIATDREDMLAANIALLVPHVRSAAQISRYEFEEMTP